MMIRRPLTLAALVSVLVGVAACTGQEPSAESGAAAQTGAEGIDEALLEKAVKLARARAAGEVCENDAYQSTILAELRKARLSVDDRQEFAKALWSTSGGIIPLTLKRNVLLHELASGLELSRGLRKGNGMALIEGSKGLGPVLRQGISFYGPSAVAMDTELRLNRNETENANEGGLVLLVRSVEVESADRVVDRNTRIEGAWKLNERGDRLTITFSGKCKIKSNVTANEGAVRANDGPKLEEASGAACEAFGYKAGSYELAFSEHLDGSGNGPTLTLAPASGGALASFFSEPSECGD